MKRRNLPGDAALCRVGAACAVLFVASCSAAPPAGAERLTVMTFNVENLFDTADDPDRRDETYLPLAAKQSDAHRALCADIEVEVWRDECLNWDWNEAVLATKLDRLAAAMLAAADGPGPDIVVLQEVENLAVLERLRREHLAAAGYRPAILIEGGDTRGIDVAILSRLPVDREPVLHRVTFADYPAGPRNDTRGILEAGFRLPSGRAVSVFAVHFPAPYHPPRMRERSYEVLAELQRNVSEDRVIIAAGDFNTTSEEDARRDTLDRLVRPLWRVAQDHGCDGCPGSFYYAREKRWNWLDTVLWSVPDGVDVRAIDVRLANTAPQQTSKAGRPMPFRLPEASGVSDHWPVVVEFELTSP